MSIDELAGLTKIPRRSLERLEAGAFDANPDGFVRGFVRTVAVALGLDPDEAVNRMLREPREDELLARASARLERRRLLLRAGLLAAALLLAFGLWRLTAAWLANDAGSADPLVFRHDAVRALAGESDTQPAPEAGAPAQAGPGPQAPPAPEAEAAPDAEPGSESAPGGR
jgi:cytoskeletal protein RodZ